jgi:hypothetical protein
MPALDVQVQKIRVRACDNQCDLLPKLNQTTMHHQNVHTLSLSHTLQLLAAAWYTNTPEDLRIIVVLEQHTGVIQRAETLGCTSQEMLAIHVTCSVCGTPSYGLNMCTV